jgi:hypothetical protein
LIEIIDTKNYRYKEKNRRATDMKIRKQILAGAFASGVMGLAACGGGGSGTQDVGNKAPEATSRAFYARAIDGYLAGATVYVDQNENNRLDAFEPRALTDNDGYFSYNHDTDTDYCAAGGLAQYCLRGAIDANAEVIIRVTGGYDTVTQLPFKGVLSLRSSELDRDDLRLVTPVTSMVADSSSGVEDKIQMLIEAGILQPGGLNEDPMESLEITRAQAAAIIARIIGEAGKVAYTPAAFEDVETDAWHAAYVAMLTKPVDTFGLNGSGTFGSTYSSAAQIAELARRSIFTAMNPGQVVPADFVLPNAPAVVPLFQFSAGLVGLNEQMITAMNGAATAEHIKAMLRLQAIAAERAVANPADPELEDLSEWVRNQLAQGNGLGSDLSELGGDDLDLSALIAPDFDFDPAANSISASAKIPAAAASTFASLVNTAFAVSVQKPKEQGAAMLFVSGTNGARSGDIDVCVRYRGDEDFNTTSSTDPNGAMLIGGRWSLLDDHTLTLSIEVVGGARSLLLKAVGANGSDRDYRFDFGNDLTEWTGSAPAGFATGAVPANDATCKAALLEKFGPMT